MNSFVKYAAAAAMTGALALSVVTPSEARNGRNTAAAIGFGAGALVGAAAASSANRGYYYDEPGYAYGEPAYYGYESGYAYEPAPIYAGPAPRYYAGPRSTNRSANPNGSNCSPSPASMNAGASC